MRTGILSFTSDENNVQLISMRALSGLWDWVALDEMKQVNLRLPDERVQHTYLGYVPYPLASLPADEARRVLKGVSLEAFGFARDEQNMIGQVFSEDRQTGRSPSAANIDTQPLAKVPTITSNSPIERLEQLCLRHPLPAIVFADRKPQGG